MTGQDVIIDFQHPDQAYRRPQLTPWELSLKRVARAQAILWHQTPIAERMAILQRVENEMKGDGQ
jgi:hypothetical protein